MKDKTYEDYQRDLAHVFRDKDYVAARRHGGAYGGTRTEEQANLDMAEYYGRKIGRLMRVLFFFLFLPFTLVAWLFINLDLILGVVLFGFMVGVIAIIVRLMVAA